MNNKVNLAKEFINKTKDLSHDELMKKIEETAGMDLLFFFGEYSEAAFSKFPGTVEGLMLLGYMVRANEETAGLENLVTQKKASA